jgi:hypothetical protein
MREKLRAGAVFDGLLCDFFKTGNLKLQVVL